MKLSHSLLIAGLLLLIGCTPSDSKKDQTADDANSDNPNEALYNQVMDVHDEVMPKMQDLYQLKIDLQEKLKGANLSEEQKQDLQNRIVRVDSVSQLMMEWMHKFDPLPDSADREDAREYLESEMEKIKKVKEAMLETIEKEKSR
jgi:hypothetical protein